MSPILKVWTLEKGIPTPRGEREPEEERAPQRFVLDPAKMKELVRGS